MHATQRRTLESLKRADVFVSSYLLTASLTPVSASLTDLVDALREAIATTDSLAADQQSGAQQMNTATRRALRSELRRDHLIPLRRVARVLESTMPGMPHVVNVPKKRSNEQSLIAAATAVAQDIAPYEDRFIGKGFPGDFVQQLESCILAVNDAKAEGSAARSRAVTATAGIRTSLQRGRDALHCLDIIVQRCCKADPVNGPAMLAEWESAHRVERRAATAATVLQPLGLVSQGPAIAA